MSAPTLSVPLRFVARETPVRRGEPVTVGLPWPRGAVADDRQFRLVGPDGSPQVLQTKVLDRWPDGSVRWCLFDFRATVDGTNDGYRVEASEPNDLAPETGTPFRQSIEDGAELAAITDTGAVLIRHGIHDESALEFRVLPPDASHGGSVAQVVLRRWPNETGDAAWRVGAEPIETGPVRLRVRWQLRLAAGVRMTVHFDCFADSPVLRVHLTVCNTNPADHDGGNWDLGFGGSVLLRELAIRLRFHDSSGDAFMLCSPERGRPFEHVEQPLALFQASSGGGNWRSSNHINRSREVPLDFPGYRLTATGATTSGRRATPVVTIDREDRFLGVAVPDFWENFPKAVTADRDGITLDLFPGQSADVHELQGGEQKTHVFYVAFARDNVTDDPMVWCRSPLLVHADPEWYASTGVIPYLTPKAADPNAGYLALVDQAIDGPDTFFHKREVIDEYGWRHFGDVYGDHEAVSHKGPAPMVSHYNNQYDGVAGFAVQFLRSADPRWWSQMVACADHTCDIDVYHTDRDKAAYNRGLFWHTYHYADADTATHRSYPRSLRQSPPGSQTDRMDQLGATAAALKKAYAVGGGPAASHNYNHGLMLAYFLTGNPLYRETAVDLAQFVIDMEDPARTPFRFLSREFTGLATESGGGGYHGPGRASGNSVNALLVGHQLTGDAKYLEKAEQLIRRVAHPMQNLDRLDLLNAELRWFYTMFLQALGRYLDTKADLGQLDRMYAYGRLTLLHYARWMAANERPILETPERLQYPTETWAAQDMRKVEVFQFAAKHAAGGERTKFLERAEWFFRYVERTLTAFPTKSLCRPLVLMLNFGWSRAWWMRHPDAAAPGPQVNVSSEDFGEWRMFVPQKAIALRRAKRVAAVGVAVGALSLFGLVWWLS